MNQRRLALECALLFIGAPLCILLVHARWAMVVALWGGALLAYALLKKNPAFTHRAEWNSAGMREGWKPVLLRFALCAALIATFTLLHDPARLFALPRQKPGLWLLVMVLYPVLSVWPQELIFRSFFLTRYAPLLPTRIHLLAASALVFGFAHIVFANWIAIGFTAVGGWMFSGTYLRYRSLALNCLEHALYGCFIFTIGLGWYFFGAAWQAH